MSIWGQIALWFIVVVCAIQIARDLRGHIKNLRRSPPKEFEGENV